MASFRIGLETTQRIPQVLDESPVADTACEWIWLSVAFFAPPLLRSGDLKLRSVLGGRFVELDPGSGGGLGPPT